MAEKNRSTWKSDKDGMFGSPPVTNSNHDPLLEDLADSVFFRSPDADFADQTGSLTISTGNNYVNNGSSPITLVVNALLGLGLLHGIINYNTDSMPSGERILSLDGATYDPGHRIITVLEAINLDSPGAPHISIEYAQVSLNGLIDVINHGSLPNPGANTNIGLVFSMMYKIL